MSADRSVRAARPDDVPEIARIQVATWQTAYAALLPAPVLAAATPERAEAEWAAAVSDPPTPRHRVLVALDLQWTVGFVAFGPSEQDTAETHVGVIHTLLVEPRWGRRGHGSRLLAAAVDHMRGDGIDTAQAWVLQGDTASTAFYESAGWERDGAVRTLVDGDRAVREVRLHVSLGAQGGEA
jgi:L-amino acid N-acyltransferase YncA